MPSLVKSLFSLTNPHHFLGLHEIEGGKKIIRLFRPGAPYLSFELKGERVEAKKQGDEGLFELVVPRETLPSDYRVYLYKGVLAHDPYSFLPTFGPLDEHLFSRGVHYKLYEVMGGRLCTHQGISGVKFTV